MREATMAHFKPILQKAKEASFNEGREKQITLAVLNGFEEGYSIQSIAKVNGISTEKVKEILQKENHKA